MKKIVIKLRQIIEPQGWWIGIVSGSLSIIDEALQWRLGHMPEFGILQWIAFFIVLGLLLLKEWQSRELTKAFNTAFKIALDHQTANTCRLIEQMAAGEVVITPQAQREIQRYLDTLSHAIGKPELADALLDQIEKIKKDKTNE